MAERQLVLCEALCFIFNIYDKVGKNKLTKVLLEDMEPVEISVAKLRLAKDVEDLHLLNQPPHIPSRRAGDSRTAREVCDIFELIEFLDENKLLDKLPIYVTDNPERMPSMKLMDGELSFILKRFEKLDDKMESMSALLVTMLNSVHAADGVRQHADRLNWPALGRGSTERRVRQPLPIVPPTSVQSENKKN